MSAEAQKLMKAFEEVTDSSQFSVPVLSCQFVCVMITENCNCKFSARNTVSMQGTVLHCLRVACAKLGASHVLPIDTTAGSWTASAASSSLGSSHVTKGGSPRINPSFFDGRADLGICYGHSAGGDDAWRRVKPVIRESTGGEIAAGHPVAQASAPLRVECTLRPRPRRNHVW